MNLVMASMESSLMPRACDCCEAMLLNSLYVTLVWFVRNIWATRSLGIALAAKKV